MSKIKCIVCGTEYQGSLLIDECPYCDFLPLSYCDDIDWDDEDNCNPVTIRQAKELLAKGRNIWGKPLPKTKDNRATKA